MLVAAFLVSCRGLTQEAAMLVLRENIRQALAGILGQTPATPIITPVSPTAIPAVTPTARPTVTPTVTPTITPAVTPTVRPAVTPTVTPTATPGSIARDALRRSLTMYSSQFGNRGIQNPTAKQTYIIETPAWLYYAVVNYAQGLVRADGRGLIEGLFQGLGYRRVGNLLAARRDDISAMELADIAVRKALMIYAATLRAQGIASPTARQPSSRQIGNTFDRIVSQARDDLRAPYYWKVGRLNYVVRSTSKISAARGAVADALRGYNYLPGAAVPVTPPATPAVTPRITITPVITPIPMPMPTPIITPVATPVERAVVTPTAPVTAISIDTVRLLQVLDQRLKIHHIPEYRGSISARLWDTIIDSVPKQYLKERYGVPNVSEALRAGTIPQRAYTMARDAVIKELGRRGYTRARVQEAVFEPAVGVTPTTEVSYPYSDPSELLGFAIESAMRRMGLEAGKGAETDCKLLLGYAREFINSAAGALSTQKQIALEYLSIEPKQRVISPGVTGSYIPAYRTLSQYGIKCAAPLSPYEMVSPRQVMYGYYGHKGALPQVWGLMPSNVTRGRNILTTGGTPFALPAEQYDYIVNQAVTIAKRAWSELSPGYRKGTADDTEWRRLVSVQLESSNVYRAELPMTVAEAYEVKGDREVTRALQIAIRMYLDRYNIPSEPGFLSTQIWSGTISSATQDPAMKILLSDLTAAQIRRASDAELRRQAGQLWTAIKQVSGEYSRLQTILRRIRPAIVQQMGYRQAPAGAVEFWTPITPAVTPVITPAVRPVITPAVTPAVTPALRPVVTPAVTPVRVVSPRAAVQRAVTEILATLDRSKTRGMKFRTTAITQIDPTEYDRLVSDSHQRASEIVARSGGDPTATRGSQWISLINAELGRRRFYRSSTPIPAVVTPAVTPVVTPFITPTIPTPVVTPALPAETPVITPAVRPEDILARWAARAPVFRTYEECRAAAARETGHTPDRWQHCMTEADVISQAVSHMLEMWALPMRLPAGTGPFNADEYDDMAEEALNIGNTMIQQRTYTPLHRGRTLRIIS